MVNSRNPVDNGVSVGIPQGYTHLQINALANAIYLQFFREHVRYCYRLNPERTKLTVFSVN